MVKRSFSMQEAKAVGGKLGIKWDRFDVGQFRRGMDVELEHGLRSCATNVTNDDAVMTGKIALAHLNEFADYYDRLEGLEKQAEKFWRKKRQARKKAASPPKTLNTLFAFVEACIVC